MDKSEAPGNQQGMLHGCRVLLVEDSYLLAVDTSRMLEAAGVHVVGPEASTNEALDLLGQIDAGGGSLNAAVLDIHLGGTDRVYALASKLRLRHVPLLFLTGYSTAAIAQEWRGVTRVEKPINGIELVTALEALLEGSAAPAEGAGDGPAFRRHACGAEPNNKPTTVIQNSREAVRHSRNVRMEADAVLRRSQETIILASVLPSRAAKD